MRFCISPHPRQKKRFLTMKMELTANLMSSQLMLSSHLKPPTEASDWGLSPLNKNHSSLSSHVPLISQVGSRGLLTAHHRVCLRHRMKE